MTIQQHASFDSSAAELNATSKLVKAWESKNAKNAAKAGGVSLMALSLAACGGSSTTVTTPVVETPVVETPVVETPVVETPVVVAGISFALTSAADTPEMSVNDDTLTAATGTLGATDVIVDYTTTDADVLTASVINATTAPRISNIETVNINGTVVSAGLDLASTSGVVTMNVNTALPTGTMTVTNASSINAVNLNAGANINTVSVTATASGTRDAVNVDTGSAANVTVAGGAGADTFVVDMVAGSTGTFDGGTSIDTYTLNLAGSATLDGATATENVTINYSGATKATVALGTNELSADYAATTNYSTTVAGTGDVTITGDDDMFNAKKIVSTSTGTVTVDVTSATDAADYTQIAVDVLELSTTAAGAVEVDVNTNTTVNLDADHTSVATINLVATTASANAGTVRINVSEDQTAAVTTGDEVGTVILTATPDEASDTLAGDDIDIAELDTDTGGATAVIISGAESMTLTLWDNNAGDTLNAQDLTGKLTISDTEAAATMVLGQGDDTVSDTVDSAVSTIYGGAGNDSISLGASAANVVYGEAGNDTIAGGSGAETLSGGDGDDTITGAAGVDTITAGSDADDVNGGAGADIISLGAGTDTMRIAATEDADVVSDFSLTDDKLILSGATGGTLDVTTVTITSGVHIMSTGNAHDVTLTGITATDFTNVVQLGSKAAAATATGGVAITNAIAYTALSGTNDDITSGSSSDVLSVAADDTGTIVTGAGSDIVIVTAAASGTAQVTDFVKGTDALIFTGTAGTGTIDVGAVTVSSGEYTLEGASGKFIVNLSNGGSALTATDMSDSIQLGTAASAFTSGGVATITGGNFNDYIALSAAGNIETVVFTQGGGVDVVTVVTVGEDFVNFDGLSGIEGSGVAVAANAAKVADAADGEIYLFADGTDGVGTQTIDFDGVGGKAGLGSTEVMTDVAEFLEAALGETSGESYVALINVDATDGGIHAAYHIAADADGIQFDDLTFLGSVTFDAAAVTTTEIA
ncbi:calcium-binding protein [Planktomarina temperata]|nr:calcium-binding protein [Planktomarina temperata]